MGVLFFNSYRVCADELAFLEAYLGREDDES